MNYELYHHGIKGQKWYVRRFQPYPKGEKPQGAKEIGRANKFASKVEKKIKANPEKYRKRQTKLENSKLAKKLGESANKKVKNSKVTNKQIERAKAMRSRIEKSSFFKKALALPMDRSGTGGLKRAMADGNWYIHHVLPSQTLHKQAMDLSQHIFNTGFHMQNHNFNQTMMNTMHMHNMMNHMW